MYILGEVVEELRSIYDADVPLCKEFRDSNEDKSGAEETYSNYNLKSWIECDISESRKKLVSF